MNETELKEKYGENIVINTVTPAEFDAMREHEENDLRNAKQSFINDLDKTLKGVFGYFEALSMEQLEKIWDQSPDSVREFYKKEAKRVLPECFMEGNQEECFTYDLCGCWGECVQGYLERVGAGISWKC